MGRLFWKLFALITLVQMLTVLAVGISFLFHDDDHGHPGPGHEHAAAHADVPTGAPPPPMLPIPGGPPGAMPPPAPPPGAHGPADHEPRRLLIPKEPVIGGLAASAITAGLLAWFLAKPIRTLRSAFAAASSGNLDVRVADRMGTGRDEVHDLGKDFDRMVERLQGLIGGQRRLLHDVSHELRSPLARMQVAIGLASQQPERGPEAMERIERESRRMDRLIGELLALARLQAGFTGRMDEEIDLAELLAVIVDDASFEAQARQRHVEAEGSVAAVVRGNAEALRRAIENVVRNAIKYSPEGGTVRVVLQAADNGSTVVVSVRDNGPGIVQADLASIFQPFFRGANGGAADGHGLGLAIAQRVVEAHGGSISAANIATGGLRVDIRLPAVPG